MSGSGPHSDDRMLQLLADRATEGIDRMEAAALDEWVVMNPDIDGDAFERAAAAVALTRTPVGDEVLPPSLRDKLLADAHSFFGWSDGA